MSGPRNPRNILLEHDCTLHESYYDDHNGRGQDFAPTQIPRGCSDGYDRSDAASGTSYSTSRRSYATPEEACTRRPLRGREIRATEYGEQFSQRFGAGAVARPVRLTDQCEPLRQAGKDVQAKGSQLPDYHEQFRQGIAENIHANSTSSRGAEMDHSRRASEDGSSRSNETRCSREKPLGTPFACHDCREPQCLYCWRKSRDASGDFSFLDGFDSREPAWKPSRKAIDQFGDSYNEPCYNGTKRATEDHIYPGSRQSKSTVSQPTHPEEEMKWRSPHNLHNYNGVQDHCPKGRDSSYAENEWQWPLGKGRGMGPVPSEWLPPFRNNGSISDNPLPPYQRSKGVGALPNLEDWVPPFRNDQQQPYGWHRCKASGGCPPRDQWLAPWCEMSEQEQPVQVTTYGGRFPRHE